MIREIQSYGVGSLEGKAGLAIGVVESCEHDENLWFPNYSNIQAVFADVLGCLPGWVQEDHYVMEIKAAEHSHSTCGGSESICNIKALV